MTDDATVFHPPVGTGTIELKLSAIETDGQLSMFLQTLPPGEGTMEHLHRDCDESGYVLEGKLKASLGDKIMEFQVGDSFFVPRDTPHAIANGGDTTAQFLFTVTPGGLENYFREVSELEANSPDRTDRIELIADKHGLEVVGPPIKL